ncbi:MAG: hypothetical protein HZB16_21395 [Armatimonadetes bacterium]|nr:hypothetical protein [Armatimonadota bacterium]
MQPPQSTCQPSAAPLSWWRFARAVVTAGLLLPLMAYWAADQGIDVILSLMVPPIGAILLLVMLNLALTRVVPKLAYSVEELILVYGMLAVGTAVASEWMDCITKQVTGYALFATEGNRFAELMSPHLPRLLFFREDTHLKDYLAGGGGWESLRANWRLWARPILGWTFLTSSLALAMLSINSLMRRQWTQQERLSFPCIQFPYALVEASGPNRPSLWRDPALWYAFAAMAAIDFANGLSFLYPGLPRINVRFLGDLNLLFTSPPWNATGWTPVGLFPFIVAMSTFLPTDLMASMVVFYWLRKAMQIVAFQMGYPQGVFGGGYLVPSPPYFGEQTWGAFLGLFLTALWLARDHLRAAWQRVRLGGSDEGDVKPRWALAGLIIGWAGCVFVGQLCGLPVWFGILYIGLFLAFSTALTRMRAELGPPTHEMAWLGPNQLVVDLMGTQGMTHRRLVGLSTTFYLFNRIHRTHPMPHQLEGMKLAERGGADQRWMAVALLLAAILGALAAHCVRIYLGYRWGAGGDGWAQTSVVNDLLTNPRRPNATALGFVGVGAGTVLLLNLLRFRLAWWPLHPVGYALAMNFGVDYYWFSLLVAMALNLARADVFHFDQWAVGVDAVEHRQIPLRTVSWDGTLRSVLYGNRSIGAYRAAAT